MNRWAFPVPFSHPRSYGTVSNCLPHKRPASGRSSRTTRSSMFDDDFGHLSRPRFQQSICCCWEVWCWPTGENTDYLHSPHKTVATTKTTTDISNVPTAGEEETGGGSYEGEDASQYAFWVERLESRHEIVWMCVWMFSVPNPSKLLFFCPLNCRPTFLPCLAGEGSTIFHIRFFFWSKTEVTLWGSLPPAQIFTAVVGFIP